MMCAVCESFCPYAAFQVGQWEVYLGLSGIFAITTRACSLEAPPLRVLNEGVSIVKYPSDSNRTWSPISKALPARLALRPKTSEARLEGRGIGAFDADVLRDTLELRAEDEDADEEGLPVTERRPD